MKIGFDRYLMDWNEEEGVEEIVSVCNKTGATSVWYFTKAALDGECTRETIRESIRRFRRIKSPLKEAGLEAGFHFYVIGFSERGQQYSDAFQHILGANGKECRAAFCPLDPDFQRHAFEVVQEFAGEAPDFIATCMDDMQLSAHFPATGGCVCPRHIELFNSMNGSNLTKEEIITAMKSDLPATLGIKNAVYNLERESILMHVKNVRKAINSVDPTIPMIIVNSKFSLWPATEKFLAAAAVDGRRPRLKYHGGIYMNDTKHLLSSKFSHIAFQLRITPSSEDDFWEADIFPYHRFSISTATLRSLITGIRLLGVPNLWMTLGSHLKVLSKAKTCRMFHEMLDKNKPYFSEIDRVATGLEFQGPSTLFHRDIFDQIGWNESCTPKATPTTSGWQSILGTLAVPHRIGEESPVKMLTGNIAPLLPRAEIEKALQGGLLLDGAAAQYLCEIGHSDQIGARVHGEKPMEAIFEKFHHLPEINHEAVGEYMGAMHNPQSIKIIEPQSEKVLIASSFYYASEKLKAEPALVLFENETGGRIATYAYDLTGPVFGFAGSAYPYLFKNDDRREQLIGVLEWLARKPLPAVTNTGVEAYLMYGTNKNTGEDVMALFNSCYDPMEPLEIRFARGTPKNTYLLEDNGKWRELKPQSGKEWLLYDISVKPMQPLLMRLVF